MFAALRKFLLNGGFFAGSNPHWRPERDMPDQTGRCIVVTGANTGIGYESCKYLLKAGAKVYVLSRTPSKGEEAVKSLNALGYKGEAHFIQCDLADLTSVRKAATGLLAKETEIHALILNAGVMFMLPHEASHQKTAQGHEVQFGTNVLGHNFLFDLLKPAIEEAAVKSEPGSVRVVCVSSSGHFLLPTKAMLTNWDTSDEAASKLKSDVLYGRSKLGNVHQMHAFADELESKGVVVTSLHPGNISSDLTRYTAPLVQWIGRMLILHPVYYGCISQLYAATAKDVQSRDYFVPWAIKTNHSEAGGDKQKIQSTVEWCREQSKAF